MEDLTPEFQKRLLSVIDYVGESAKATADFALEQTSLVAQEIVRWGIVSALIQAASFLIVVIVLLAVSRVLFKKYAANTARALPDDECFGWGIAGWLVLAAAVFTSIGVFVNLSLAAKPLVAPCVYLIEWCGEQLKGRR